MTVIESYDTSHIEAVTTGVVCSCSMVKLAIGCMSNMTLAYRFQDRQNPREFVSDNTFYVSSKFVRIRQLGNSNEISFILFGDSVLHLSILVFTRHLLL